MEFNVNGWSFSCAQLVGAPRRERETLSRLEASFLPRGSLFSLPLSPVSRLPSQKKNRINPVRVLSPGEQFRAVGERRVQRWAWIQISVAHWRVTGRKGSGRRTPRVDLQNDRRISPRGWIRAPLRRRLVFLGISGILEDFPGISMLLRTTSVRKKREKRFQNQPASLREALLAPSLDFGVSFRISHEPARLWLPRDEIFRGKPLPLETRGTFPSRRSSIIVWLAVGLWDGGLSAILGIKSGRRGEKYHSSSSD